MSTGNTIRLAKARAILIKHLPGQEAFITDFLHDRGHGIPHGRKVFRIANEQLNLSNTSLAPNDLASLQWACLIHDIADVKNSEQYRAVFGDYSVNKTSMRSLLVGLDFNAEQSITSEITTFENALGTPDEKLRPYHHLTAAVFALRALGEDLGKDGARLAAQAILLHSERSLSIFPDNTVIRLLRDADKIEGLNISRLVEINKKAGRIFFDPAINWSLRQQMIRGAIRPERQEQEAPRLKLDTLQFAGIRSLFVDTNPTFYANPLLVKPYLTRHGMFSRFLNDVMQAAKKETFPKLLRPTLETLRNAIEYAQTQDAYRTVDDQLKKGNQKVNRAIKRLDSLLSLS